MKRFLGSLGMVILVGCPAQAQEKLPEGRKLVRVQAFPPAIELKTPFAYRQVLLTGVLDNGESIDVTRLAQLQPSKVAKASTGGLVRPVVDGEGQLTYSIAGHSITIPCKVSGQKMAFEASFVRDVMPTMSKLGCNAGTCHGAQAGKNGFKLSLRGYDPLFDHQALTDDLEGRRFNRADPDRSLMLLKPSGGIPHVGGAVMQPGEPAYELLRTWISQGVKLDLGAERVASIQVVPQSVVIGLPGMKQQIAVIASYADGSTRDVSAEAFIESSNNEVATVDKQGLVTAVRRGEATMLARYEGAYSASSLIVMGDRTGFAWKDQPQHNYIDSLVDEKLKQVKVLPSPICTDAEFIRRVYLDLTGLPPEPEEIRAFLNDSRPTRQKREAMVDRLVGSPEYIEYWTNKWADLLQVNRKYLGEKGALALRNWIRQAISTNMPYDKFVHAILTASGSTMENPPAAYYKVQRDAASTMENTTQLFLAIRFNCNKCHDHPFERWTQDQYYHLSAYFSHVGRKEDPHFRGQKVGGSNVEAATPLVEIIYDRRDGEVKHERTGQIAKPSFPYTHAGSTNPTEQTRREELASWITSPSNPYFARSYVNRLFSYLLGVGLIEPVDDIRAGNPPSNPKLLNKLANELVQSGFDVQQMMRTICKSRVYQQSIVTNRWNQDDEINYSHALARRLPAESLFDAIHRATGSTSRLGGMPVGQRAAQQLDTNVETPNGFLDQFGRPARESACECERSGGVMLGPVLNMINGPVVAEAIKDPANRLTKLAATIKDDNKLVEEIFLAMLCRFPTDGERKAGLRALQGSDEEYQRLAAEHNRYKLALEGYEKLLPARVQAWEKAVKESRWIVLDSKKATSRKNAELVKQPDKSLLATGSNVGPQTYSVTAESPLSGVTGIRLEVMADSRLPGSGPGRAANGNFVLSELRVMTAPKSQADKLKAVLLQNSKADFSQDGFAVAGAIDGNEQTGWAIVPATGKTHVAVFEVKEPAGIEKGSILTFMLSQQYQGKDHQIGRFRLSVTTAKPPLPLEGMPEDIITILSTPEADRNPVAKQRLQSFYQSQDMELARLRKQVADHPLPSDKRLIGAQDLAWALINSPSFMFNH